ncbi:hypothetical protein HMPREF3226_01207 [Prevotella corporis]|uniref:Uncharacterized protein n=1 Tax=Prevotella corporis TaxID=28128 RepID=A0A133Q929_9BACT|nr:hypothetical protein HMPREF3226_01207 [Prevotella corporis]
MDDCCSSATPNLYDKQWQAQCSYYTCLPFFWYWPIKVCKFHFFFFIVFKYKDKKKETYTLL